MTTPEKRTTVALSIDPADAPAEAIPAFARDPYRWFEGIRAALFEERSREIVDGVQPDTWANGDGHAWRIVRTTRGVEVRPDLSTPFMRHGRGLRVTAIGIGEEEIEVELAMEGGHWVDRFPCTSLDLAEVGRAMLEQRELPHDNLTLLFPLRDS